MQERGLVHRQPVRGATAEHSLRLQRRHQESDAARRQSLPPSAAQRSHRVRRYSATWCLSILRCRHCRVLVHIFFPNRVVAAEGITKLVIVGGGAGGIELSLNMRERFNRDLTTAGRLVTDVRFGNPHACCLGFTC